MVYVVLRRESSKWLKLSIESHLLGPLHMSPVNRAGSVSKISPRHSFLCKNIDVFTEGPGWPGYRDLGFATNISVTGMKIFAYEHSSPVTGTKLFKQNCVALTTYRPKWHNFGLVCISSLGVCELALLVQLQDSTKLWQSRTIQVHVPPFWLCFLNFIPVDDRAEISHMNTPQNSSR